MTAQEGQDFEGEVSSLLAELRVPEGPVVKQPRGRARDDPAAGGVRLKKCTVCEQLLSPENFPSKGAVSLQKAHPGGRTTRQSLRR